MLLLFPDLLEFFYLHPRGTFCSRFGLMQSCFFFFSFPFSKSLIEKQEVKRMFQMTSGNWSGIRFNFWKHLLVLFALHVLTGLLAAATLSHLRLEVREESVSRMGTSFLSQSFFNEDGETSCESERMTI